MLHRNDCNELAKIVQHVRKADDSEKLNLLTTRLADFCARRNTRFDRQKFVKVCNYE